jgi:hypothetical protein
VNFPRYVAGLAMVLMGAVALGSACSSSSTGNNSDGGPGADTGATTGLTTGLTTAATTGTTTGTTTSATTATTTGTTTGATTSTTTGVTTGLDGSTVCPDAAAPAACSATLASGAIPLMGNFLVSTAAGATGLGAGVMGYAYSYNDSQNDAGGTSTACLSPTALCTTGTTDISNTTGSHYGAGIGFNLNQAQSTSCASMPINPFTVPAGSVGISYSLSNLPPGGMRLAIGNYVSATSGTDYCTTLTAASGVVPWAAFNSQCWVNTAGDFLTGPPTAPIHIEFQLPSGATAGTFDFCVDSVGFATSLDGGGGGTTSTNCNGSSCCEPSSGPAANGDGSLTCYTFKQGTPNNKTYCGYQGSETTYTGGGSGACQSQNNTGYTDTIPNVGPPSDYFAAFPGPGGPFGNGALCGMCVNVTYAGKTLMGTIADECPSSSNSLCGVGSNHLDLSAALARDLGIGVGTTAGNPTGVTWSAVACPIPTSQNNGNITVVWNASGQAYFQNVVWPVASVSGATQSNGYWSVNAGATVTLTDLIGHTITATMPGAGGGSLGKQFPSTCTN